MLKERWWIGVTAGVALGLGAIIAVRGCDRGGRRGPAGGGHRRSS